MNKYFEDKLCAITDGLKPRNLYTPIEYTLESGGKRLRPMLMQMACELFGKPAQKVESSAMAIEVFHNFTLLHDDIMDSSPTRRNRPTVHTKWNNNTAILSGDAMMILSYSCLQKIPTKYWSEAFPLFTQTALEVCEGQQLDMDFETAKDVSLEEYFEMIRLKTAVLLACSLKLGAIIAEANPEDAELLYDFGIALGIAFQLRDDYLDAFGSTKILGKPIGGDIACGKKTFLTIKSIDIAPLPTQLAIGNLLKNKDIEKSEKIERMVSIYRELEIEKLCKIEIEKYCNEATQKLEKISIDSSRKRELAEIVKKLQNRDK